jgi:hydroxymethylpyrimidine pyrophosphatase-like HAD family hydrolase
MSSRATLSELIDESRIERLRLKGALVLDVDDTLLARERTHGAGQETFEESAAAALLPDLLRRGFRLCLITGHGWRQLEERLVGPIVERLRESGEEAVIENLWVYANRGATKITWDGSRHRTDKTYGEVHQLCDGDVPALRRLLESLGAEFEIDVKERGDWYREAFPRFDFGALPAMVAEREGAVLVLRPLPARIHTAPGELDVDLRAKLHEHGLELLERANFADDYQLACSGRSSIEITRRSVSKEAAMRDLIAGLSAVCDESEDRVEESLVYVGDEFFKGGNDFVIPLLFPHTLCLSVAGEYWEGETPAAVEQLTHRIGVKGTAAAEVLLRHFLNLSA